MIQWAVTLGIQPIVGSQYVSLCKEWKSIPKHEVIIANCLLENIGLGDNGLFMLQWSGRSQTVPPGQAVTSKAPGWCYSRLGLHQANSQVKHIYLKPFVIKASKISAKTGPLSAECIGSSGCLMERGFQCTKVCLFESHLQKSWKFKFLLVDDLESTWGLIEPNWWESQKQYVLIVQDLCTGIGFRWVYFEWRRNWHF